MPVLGTLIIIVIIYMAYQLGRIKGKAEMLLHGNKKSRKSTAGIEEAEFEEIK